MSAVGWVGWWWWWGGQKHSQPSKVSAARHILLTPYNLHSDSGSFKQ